VCRDTISTEVRKTGTIKNIYDGVCRLFYPDVCPICTQAETGSGICPDCRRKLRYIHGARCFKCGKQLEDGETEYCSDCMTHRHEYTQGVALWGYTDEIKNSIYGFKYGNCRCFADAYVRELADNYSDTIRRWNADVIMPVPLHAKRLKKRGFNQALLLAEMLGQLLNIPVDGVSLARSKSTVPQKELDDRQRLKNLENAFILTENVVKYKKVILIDDIYTTGATIDACAAQLKRGGVKDVYFAALCIGRGF